MVDPQRASGRRLVARGTDLRGEGWNFQPQPHNCRELSVARDRILSLMVSELISQAYVMEPPKKTVNNRFGEFPSWSTYPSAGGLACPEKAWELGGPLPPASLALRFSCIWLLLSYNLYNKLATNSKK